MNAMGPRPPYETLRLWLAIVTDATALILLWRSDIPGAVKWLVTAVLVVGMFLIIAFYLGRRYQAKRGR